MRHSVWFWLLTLPLSGQAQDIKIVDPATGKVIEAAPAQPKEKSDKPETLPPPVPAREASKPRAVDGKLPAQPRNDPLLKLPAEVTGDTDDFIRVVAETDQPVVRWYSPDKGLKLFPAEALKDTRTAICFSKKPGRYRLVAVVAKDDVPSAFVETTVVVGDAPPGPGPGPTPPPDPDAPKDPLHQPLLAAYYSETAADKEAIKGRLAGFYEAAAETAKDETYKTWGALLAAMKGASQNLNVFGKLVAVQQVLQGEMSRFLPSDGAMALDAAGRETAANLFLRFARALREVK